MRGSNKRERYNRSNKESKLIMRNCSKGRKNPKPLIITAATCQIRVQVNLRLTKSVKAMVAVCTIVVLSSMKTAIIMDTILNKMLIIPLTDLNQELSMSTIQETFR